MGLLQETCTVGMGVMPKKNKKAKAAVEATQDVAVSEPKDELESMETEVEQSTEKLLKKEKKKRKKSVDVSLSEEVTNITASPTEESECVAIETVKTKKKKKSKANNNETMVVNTEEDKAIVDPPQIIDNEDAEKDSKQDKKGAPSTVRASKSRLKEDCAYIADLLTALHIPQHKRVEYGEEEEGEERREEVPEEARKRLHLEPVVGTERAASREELKDRLEKKLEELRGRKLGPEESRRQKKMKKKIAAIEKSKGKDDLKQKLMKIGKNAGNTNKGVLKDAETGGAKISKPSVKTEKGVVFSKFDFQGEEGEKETKKNLDPQAALNKIKKNKEKVKLWEEKGKTEKAKNIETNIAWQNALGKAEGEKIKDDEFLLKKSIKKQKQIKNSKLKKWEKRVEGVESGKEAGQTKREENISKRKKDKKEKKMKHLVAKGRHVPGS